MNRFDATIIGYSLLLMIGGVTGYFVSGSLASLLMSSIFAILLIGALFSKRFWPQVSIRIIFGLLAALTLFFTYRAWYTAKFAPAGILALLTIAVLGFSYGMCRKKSS